MCARLCVWDTLVNETDNNLFPCGVYILGEGDNLSELFGMSEGETRG